MAKKQRVPVKIPAGFVIVKNVPGDSHDFTSLPVLSGIVKRVKTRTQKNEFGTREVRVANIHRGDKVVSLWESADLVSFFDEVQPGDEVYVRFDGLEEIEGTDNAKKKFTTAIRRGATRANPSQG